jgi:hypothetical protein
MLVPHQAPMPRAVRPLEPCLAAVMLMLGSAILGGCGGSAQAKTQADASADGQSEVDFEAEAGWETTEHTLSAEQTDATGRPSTPQTGAASTNSVALLGARHDVTLTEDAPVNCKCLSAALGPETDPRFVWGGQRPVLDRGAQLVVGLRSTPGKCQKDESGASYTGYELRNGDVIVKVEAAVAGRPLTRGAIIPRPGAGKEVYIEPVGNIAYGRGLGDEPRCSLGTGK